MRTLATLTVVMAMLVGPAEALAAPVDVYDRLLIEDVVVAALAVPDDAVVEDIVAAAQPAEGQVVVCGRVNGKAVNGEYMGFMDFTGVLATVPGAPSQSSFTRLRIGSCPLDPAERQAAIAP